jgi:hypothetical protein
VPDDRRALRAARPVVAGFVVPRRKGAAVGLRAGQRIVLVWSVAEAVDDVALLGQVGLLSKIVVAVQLIDILGDHHAFGVLPRPAPDTVARIDGRLAVGHLGAEIGMPGVISGRRALREPLADLVGTGQTTEICAFAGAGAGHEEGHIGRLRPQAAAHG